ncbi:MAG: endonuclease/exonuclease/phosphatase family protein [Erythrobacter sp.]
MAYPPAPLTDLSLVMQRHNKTGAGSENALELTFASYNIHKAIGLDRRRDPERIIAVLRELDADVIALQESDRRFGERVATLPRVLLDDTPWRVAPVARRRRSIGWHGNAMLVRRGITIKEAERIALPGLEPRGAVRVDLHKDGHDFRAVGTHLDLSGMRRRAQIKTILAHCAGRTPEQPSVIMGDFNQWSQRRGAIRSFGENWRVLRTEPSYPSRRPIARLDRIVASTQWECTEWATHHSAMAVQASDHLPIYARMLLPKI